MSLTPEQKDALQDLGYVNLGPVLGPEELARIRAEYDLLVRPEKQTLGNEIEGKFPYRAMLNFHLFLTFDCPSDQISEMSYLGATFSLRPVVQI